MKKANLTETEILDPGTENVHVHIVWKIFILIITFYDWLFWTFSDLSHFKSWVFLF
jgi:hypothetical protein